MCTQQSRKVIWDMINTLVPDTVAVESSIVAFFKQSQTYLYGLLCHSFKFLWRTKNSKPPIIPFRIVARTFSDNLSRNSCLQHTENPNAQKKYCYKDMSLPILTHHDQLCLSLGSKTQYLLELQDKSKQ